LGQVNTRPCAVAAAPTVVVKAATILEEEVAMGLRAVQRIEQRFLDVDALRAQDSDAVMSKFRRDAHDAVDIILDVLTAAAQSVGAQAGRLVNVTAGATPLRKGALGRHPVPASAFGALPRLYRRIAMSPENPGDAGTITFMLQASDLVGVRDTFRRRSVTFNPATLEALVRQARCRCVYAFRTEHPLERTKG
jgi:hypothetical protein